MAEEKFSDNLMRVIAAELHLLNGMTAAREPRSRGSQPQGYRIGADDKHLLACG
jgi:hypothetical protein